MNKIISKEHFSEKVFKLVIEAPLIAKSRKAGHFVIVRVGEKGERMPLTIAAADPVKGTITLVVQEVGQINYLCAGGRILGAVKMATIWLIPKDAEKPADRRFKNTKK